MINTCCMYTYPSDGSGPKSILYANAKDFYDKCIQIYYLHMCVCVCVKDTSDQAVFGVDVIPPTIFGEFHSAPAIKR